MIFKDNEKKRSTIWRTVLTVSSVIIIIVAVFFVIRLFTSNPLEGKWVNEDSGEVLMISSDGTLTLSGEDAESSSQSKEEYSIDKQNKIFSVWTSDASYAEGMLSGSYNYNIEKNTLTLTEREYGDQLVFIREEN